MMIVNHKVIHSSISSFHLSLTIGFVFEHDSGLTDSLSDYTPSPSVMMIPVLKARGRERVVRTEEALSDRGRINYVSGDVLVDVLAYRPHFGRHIGPTWSLEGGAQEPEGQDLLAVSLDVSGDVLVDAPTRAPPIHGPPPDIGAPWKAGLNASSSSSFWT